MPRYRIAMTHVADVVARDQKHAIALANEEILDSPEFSRSITAFEHDLSGIAKALKTYGLAVYYDDYKNNAHDFLRIDFVEREDVYTYDFQLVCNLDDRLETYDGTGYTLTMGGHEMITVGHRPANDVAELVSNALDVHRPKSLATLEEITELLTAMGYTAMVVDFGRYEGQPKVVEFVRNGIGYTLYQNLNGNDEIAGTGYHLSLGDDESQLVAEIGNNRAPQVCAEIVERVATKKWVYEG